MKVTFYGGTGSVTGANFLIENSGGAGDIKFVVDCGMMQGSKIAESFNLDPFPVSYTHLTLPTNREV